MRSKVERTHQKPDAPALRELLRGPESELDGSEVVFLDSSVSPTGFELEVVDIGSMTPACTFDYFSNSSDVLY